MRLTREQKKQNWKEFWVCVGIFFIAVFMAAFVAMVIGVSLHWGLSYA